MNEKFNSLKKTIYSSMSKLKELEKAIEMMEDQIFYSSLNNDEKLEYEVFQGTGFTDGVRDLLYSLEYLSLPIKKTGQLYKNDSGRYEIDHNYWFTCGDSIEVYIFDSFREVNRWVKTRVEHKDGDYCLWGYSHISMDGLLARVRR